MGKTLINTRWRFESQGVRTYFIDFLPDGEMRTRGTPARGGKDHWSLKGSHVTLVVNDGYVTYEGEWTDPITMGGTGKNIKGETMVWRATRVHH